MGLRFRKSITLLPGVKVNFGKTGASLSLGFKGFHTSIHTSGKVTATASVPGTGISYQKSKNVKTLIKKAIKDRGEKKAAEEEAEAAAAAAEAEAAAATAIAGTTAAAAAAAVLAQEPAPALPADAPAPEETAPAAEFHPAQLTEEALRGIHKTYDDAVDWVEVSQSETPPDESYDAGMWSYFHQAAPAVLNGDIDAYLQVISDVRPLDDLLDYGGQFQFGTDRPSLMEVEFTVNEETLEAARLEKNVIQFYDLLQDFVCSTCIRVARDLFALLPVSDVAVHAVMGEDTVVSVLFDRATMEKIRFGFVDPSDVLDRFQHRMEFYPGKGFTPVTPIDTTPEA